MPSDIFLQTGEQLIFGHRYYQGLIDLNIISRGEDYDKLKKSFIIFIKLGVNIEQKHQGIYSVTGLAYFPMQIVVLKELDKHEYPE